MNKIVWLEGPDNCGKSTIIKRLEEHYLLENSVVSVVSQPASCDLGKLVYNLHHDYTGLPINSFSKQLLHVASHIQYHHEQMNVKQTYITLSDRSFISTLAYFYANPVTTDKEATENQINFLLDLELAFLPNKLTPTSVFILNNKPFERSEESYENYEKVIDGYRNVIPIVKKRLPSTNFYWHNAKKDKIEDSIKDLIELI